MALKTLFLAPDSRYLGEAAKAIASFFRDDVARTPAEGSIVVPNLKMAAPLMRELGAAWQGHLLLPRIETVSGMVEPWLRGADFFPDARRRLVLHALLRARRWFDEAMLWDVVGELVALFDTLTDHAVALPDTEEGLLARLETAFGLRNAQPLAFEARLVHTLWRAEAQGKGSRRAAQLLAMRSWIEALRGPLVMLSEDRSDPILNAIETLAATRVPVLRILPDRLLCQTPTARMLRAAWPPGDDDAVSGTLLDRSGKLTPQDLDAAQHALTLCEAASLEELAGFVCEQVLTWLEEGRRNIALVAVDRIVARRARALLERHAVLVDDETGWKLSTTRAAATVDALLEVLATDAFHRALIDLLRSPFLFSDVVQKGVSGWVADVERALLETQITSGLDRITAAVAGHSAGASSLLGRLAAARRTMSTRQEATIADWLSRLMRALDDLGAVDAMERDAAGVAWLDWLVLRRDELSADGELFSFAQWRNWFNREMDDAMFRDTSIDSPIVMTHLAATRLRAFDGSIVIGADTEHLAPPRAPSWLNHAGVRRELGLPGLEQERDRIREDLAGLILASGKAVICWQGSQRDEVIMPAADVDVLARLWSQAVQRPVVIRPSHAYDTPRPVSIGEIDTAPSAPIDRVPEKVSATALKTLFDCPYRYFARYVLRLQETLELPEGLEKRDFGTLIHAILKEFHDAWPSLLGTEKAILVDALEAITEQHFAPAIERSFLDQAWRLRWRGHIESYIDWQCQRERDGWSVLKHEQDLRRSTPLPDGKSITLYGRIDRRDVRRGISPGGFLSVQSQHDDAEERVAGDLAVLDYKARPTSALRKQVKDPDDVQLAFYALLHETPPAEAAYVSVDDEVASTPLDDIEGTASDVLQRLHSAFHAMRQGAGMPANGVEGACGHCEMAGLCRQEWVR